MALSDVAALLACPVCGAAMAVRERALVCRDGHSFDVARQGHVNLLGRAAPANADTAEMLAARDRFLSAGWYRPIEELLVQRVGSARRLLEVGAGTGHYLARVLDARPDAVGLATDVSPMAARRAARAHTRIGAVVADTWAGLPVRSSAVDAVLCVFAPRNPDEFARVCVTAGTLVVVTPNAAHLAQARDELGLLGVEEDKLARLNRSLLGRFDAVASRRLVWRMDLDAHSVRDLVQMGPNAFHAHDERYRPMTVDADVTVSLFRKPSQQG